MASMEADQDALEWAFLYIHANLGFQQLETAQFQCHLDAHESWQQRFLRQIEDCFDALVETGYLESFRNAPVHEFSRSLSCHSREYAGQEEILLFFFFQQQA